MRNYYEVIVGNIGTVYADYNRADALHCYRDYCYLAKFDLGRAAGEQVVLLRDGEIYREQAERIHCS